MRGYANGFLRAARWLMRGAGGYQDIPHVKIKLAGIVNFQAAIVVWRLAKLVTNYRIVDGIAKLTEKLLRNAAAAAPLWIHAQRALGYVILFQGRRKEALVQFGYTESLRDKLARVAGWEPDTHVFLPRECYKLIGGIGSIDGFVKRRILTGDQRPYYLLADRTEIANQPFLDYWADYITIVTDPTEIHQLSKFEAVYGVGWIGAIPRGNAVVHVHRGIAAVQRQWSREKRAPLLRLHEEHARLLASHKIRWGMTETDWFICLHVRSPGFYGERAGGSEDFRNAPIEDYYPLIRMIVAAGGWVVRMGDRSMPPLDLTECGNRSRVLDYAISADKSSAMDVALSASCALFVGHSSGLHTVPHAFGRPCCLVNIPINAGFPWHTEDVFIPKRYFSVRTKSVLPFEKIFASNLVEADNQFLLAKAGVMLLPNAPDDIVETVREALWPDSYEVAQASKGDSVIEEFERLNQRYETEISGRLGRYYAGKYASELSPTQADSAR